MPIESLEQFETTLPQVVTPVANYVMSVQTGNLVYTSGVLPMKEGKLQFEGPMGTLLYTIEDGQEASRLCLINVLSVLKEKLGSLSRIKQVVKLTGYVSSLPAFTQQPAVINGASDLLVEVFGDAGRHARAAVGVAALPLNATVELDLLVEVE